MFELWNDFREASNWTKTLMVWNVCRMISTVLSRLIILLFGVLYPAYASYKAVKNKDVRAHLQWMMYWIVFAFFTCIETVSDIFISFWMPFYYEFKILFVLWLLSPATKGSSILYRRFVHPQLVEREQEIDELIEKAKEQGYATMLLLGSRGLSYATSVVLQTAIKAQEAIASHKISGIAGTRNRLARPDGIALAWEDMDSDSENLPEMLEDPFSHEPFVGAGDSLDIDNNVYGENLDPHDELSVSPCPVPAKAPRLSNKNRNRNTAKTTDWTGPGPTRRSTRASKNASKK